MDLLHFMWHCCCYYFSCFLTIIMRFDCDHVQYLSWFSLLIAVCLLSVLIVFILLYSLLYRRSLLKVKEDRHVA
uniref:6b accessory protein n=2 Tax=Avian coronavirus TaxID=694014 RepID=A0A291B667_9GAMC|nr:6b accessory protein [Avian coronavirus]ATE90990.1 6b accessory protein [Avian coronavirus]QKV27973.1 putative 7 protein [Infectious bronchitis virus]